MSIRILNRVVKEPSLQAVIKKIHRQKPGRHNRIIVYIVNPVPLFLPASRLPSVQVF